MFVNSARDWLRNKVRSHFADKILKVGELTFRAKLLMAAAVAAVAIVILGGLISTVAAVAGPFTALASFLNMPGLDGSEPDNTSNSATSEDDTPGCFTNRVDPSFTELIKNTPTGIPMDLATGWLIYAAPHQQQAEDKDETTETSTRLGSDSSSTPSRQSTAPSTAPAASERHMDFDEFKRAWNQVIDGTYRRPSKTGPPRTSSATSSIAKTSQPESGGAPSGGVGEDASVLDVVTVIDPFFDYSEYVEQADAAAIYLLVNQKVEEPPVDVAGDLMGGAAQACAEDSKIPTVPLLTTPTP